MPANDMVTGLPNPQHQSIRIDLRFGTLENVGLGRLEEMAHFAAPTRDGDWTEMASEGASERLRRSPESVLEPRGRQRA